VTPAEWSIVRTEAGWQELVPEWRRLAGALPEPSMFLTPEWAGVWWRHFGEGRRLHLAAAHRDGDLVALAPLCTRRGPGGVRVREWIGSEEADLQSLLVAPAEADLAPGLARFAVSDTAWDLVDLWCLPPAEPAAEAWRRALLASGVRHEQTRQTVNPVLSLRGDAWQAGVRREHLGRKRRALERRGTLRLVLPRDEGEVRAALADFRGLHVARWRERGEISRLALPGYWAWVRDLVEEAWRQRWLYLPRLELDGTLLATGLYFLYRRRLFQWMNAHHLAEARHSPFNLLIMAVIEDMRARDAADVLDFGRGDEGYKGRWTDQAVDLSRVLAWRRARGRVAYLWQGRVRPWAWAHPEWSRPVRSLKRSVGRLVAGLA
jgi:CelD/BcsL family acetyltransferase involved in cellulose biosynthesis